jgi:pilus assembly protein Flp/PilA
MEGLRMVPQMLNAELAAGMGCRKLRQQEEITMNFLKRLWQEEDGQDLVEYALLLVLVALAATVGMKTLATAINSTFGTAETNLTTNAT